MSSKLIPLKLQNVELSENCAVFDTERFEDWFAVGLDLCRMSAASMWWLGDWCVYGQDKFKDRYAQAAAATGYDRGTLHNAAWLSRQVPISRRRENLSWSHHMEVAGLEAKEQAKFLEEAAAGHWTRADLREAVRESKAGEEERDPGPVKVPFNPSANCMAFMRWFRQQLEISPLEEWPAGRRAALKSDLAPLVDVWKVL